jgi:tetratricopeptide (TPR) repeat protein
MARWLLLSAIALSIAAAFWYYSGQAQRRSDRLRGLELARTGAFDQAESFLLAAARHRPDDVEAAEALARGYAEQNHPDAETCLDRWVALRPSECEPLLQRMEFHARRQNHDKALADAERVLELDPSNVAGRQAFLSHAVGAGKHSRAERGCREALARDSSDRHAFRLLIQALRGQGRYDEAVAVLEAQLRKTPNDSGLLVALGQVYYEAGQPRQAISVLRQALDDPQRWGTSRYYLALALKQDGQEVEANQLLTQLSKRREADILVSESNHFPEHIGLKVKAARACMEIDLDSRALEFLNNVVALDPGNAEAHGLLAKLHDKHGRPNLAASHRRLAGTGKE